MNDIIIDENKGEGRSPSAEKKANFWTMGWPTSLTIINLNQNSKIKKLINFNGLFDIFEKQGCPFKTNAGVRNTFTWDAFKPFRHPLKNYIS